MTRMEGKMKNVLVIVPFPMNDEDLALRQAQMGAVGRALTIELARAIAHGPLGQNEAM